VITFGEDNLRWEFSAQKFAIDALGVDASSITLDCDWHIPTAYQLTALPELEIEEEVGLFKKRALITFIAGGKKKCAEDFTRIEKLQGLNSETGHEYDGTLWLYNDILQFSWYFSSAQLLALKANLVAMACATKKSRCAIKFSGQFLIGNLSLEVNSVLKEEWFAGAITAGLIGTPMVSIIYSDDYAEPATESMVYLRHKDEI
jgi:hypothetical protein